MAQEGSARRAEAGREAPSELDMIVTLCRLLESGAAGERLLELLAGEAGEEAENEAR